MRDQPHGQVARDVAQAKATTGAGRVLDRERLAEPVVPAQQRLDEQVVDREPDRTAPVGVAAEQAGRRLAGLVVDRRGDAPDRHAERLVAVAPRQRAQAMRRQERILVEDLAEHAFERDGRQEAEQEAIPVGRRA